MKKFVILMVLLLFSFLFLCAQESYNILVVHSYHSDLPWTASVQSGFSNIKNEYDGEIQFFYEYMDTVRIQEIMPDSLYADYIEEKYRSVGIDAVIGDSDRASGFIRDYCGFLGTAPRVLYTARDLSEDNYTYCLVSQYETALKRTMDFILEQHPDTQTVELVRSVDPGGEAAVRILTPYLKNTREGIEFRELEFSTIDSLVESAASLTAGSVLLYTPVTYDSTGNSFIPKDVLGTLMEEVPVPVYTFWSSLLGNGAVGGYVIDGASTGHEMIRAALDYLNTGRFSDDYNNLRYVFDWKALQIHDISEYSLPEGSILIDKPVPVFVTYFREVMIGIIGLIALFLIISLFWVKSISETNRKLKEANKQIEEARQAAENMARHDTLTGLLNRRAILPIIRYEISRKRRMNGNVSLLILDIDHFKAVNDAFGHDVGDRVLQKIAGICAEVSRATDRVARWGGEEFVILAPDTVGNNALVLGEKIRNHIMHMDFDNIGEVTVSIGIAELKKREEFGPWFQRADSALYNAKAGGRNMCILAGLPDMEEPEQSMDQLIHKLHLQWHPKYSSGNSTIDTQHNEILELTNKLVDLVVDEHSDEEVFACIETISTKVRTHFFEEEKILKRLRFGDLEIHKEKHAALVEDFFGRYNDFKQGDSDIYSLLRFLSNDLVLIHILNDDSRFFHLTK